MPVLVIRSTDALLVVGFGGPEKMEDVIPFLENVLRGRNVPRERLLAVAGHYEHFGGKSPLNDHLRELIAALRTELATHDIKLPVYWGNRNWHPLLADTLRDMTAAGVKRALAWVASAYSSYSGCRQYLGDIDQARQAAGPAAPTVDKLRVFYNHPLFVAANAERLSAALENVSADRRAGVHVAFTAHSIPEAMAKTSGIRIPQLRLRRAGSRPRRQASRNRNGSSFTRADRAGRKTRGWAPISATICVLVPAGRSSNTIVDIMPIGFLSDHMEVLYDLDYEARLVADELGLSMVRAGTVGTHPLFVQMLRELIEERLSGSAERQAIGAFPAWPDVCPADCCPAARPGPPSPPHSLNR